MQDKDLLKHGLSIVCSNAYQLATQDKDAFVMLRRCGLGASDSAVYLGVNKFTNIEALIDQKLALEVTAEEREVGEKEVVRKGSDLEPLILQKFEAWAGVETHKPDAMYNIIAHPQLNVDFDGVIDLSEIHIPVEAKFVSMYANKYWDRSKCIDKPYEGNPRICAGVGIVEHINMEAELYGIPCYYYPQIQQQMLALNAPFGYFAVMFDKGWEFKVYKVFADKYTQDCLITESEKTWNIIQSKKNGGSET